MGYLVKTHTTANDVEGNSTTHFAGDVVSDWELTDHVREQIDKGTPWYAQRFEKLTPKEEKACRVKATMSEGKRQVEGQVVDPPWDDYIGLHPKEVIERMKDLNAESADKVRQYERGGRNRSDIVEYVTRAEREPWHDYDNWGIRDILDKLSILDEDSVHDAIVYEQFHKERPAILEWSPEEYEDSNVDPDQTSSSDDDGGKSDDSSLIPAGVGADSTEADR